MEAVLVALEEVGGDLSEGGRRFRAALARVELAAPNGPVRLDANRQAVAASYLRRVEAGVGGKLAGRPFRTIADVDQSFGGLFTASSPPAGRGRPPCRRSEPPPWARR
jgi:hypothetical protein